MISLSLVFQKNVLPNLLDRYENLPSLWETNWRTRVIVIPLKRINNKTKERPIFLMQFIDLKPNSLKYWLRGTPDVSSNKNTFDIIEYGFRKSSWEVCIVYLLISLVIPGTLTEIKESIDSWDNAWSIPHIRGIAPDLSKSLIKLLKWLQNYADSSHAWCKRIGGVSCTLSDNVKCFLLTWFDKKTINGTKIFTLGNLVRDLRHYLCSLLQLICYIALNDIDSLANLDLKVL